jgi:hydroxybutyrate-dimer hydrolase
LRASGWTDAALRAGSISVAFDLWRAVGVTYASTYGRYGAGEHPCKYAFAAMTPTLAPRPATAVERSAWWADAAGVAPGAGVGIVDGMLVDGMIATTPDPTLPGLRCLRALWDGQGPDADRVRKGIAETRAALPRDGLPIIVIHGLDDGLVPPAFTSAPYVAKAKAVDRDVRYWQVRKAQHFDAFLGFPQYGAQYLPMLPYVYAALDRAWAHLENGSELPPDAVIDTTSRGAGKPLDAGHLSMPR